MFLCDCLCMCVRVYTYICTCACVHGGWPTRRTSALTASYWNYENNFMFAFCFVFFLVASCQLHPLFLLFAFSTRHFKSIIWCCCCIFMLLKFIRQHVSPEQRAFACVSLCMCMCICIHMYVCVHCFVALIGLSLVTSACANAPHCFAISLARAALADC